jgi:uncharacterized protein YndB with AHSA1/START domain
VAVPETDLAVERDVFVAAAPEIVFDYFTKPELLTRWQADEVDVDVRPGGSMRLHVSSEHIARGDYIAIEPPRRVVFTWGWEGNTGVPPGSSTVEVTFEPEGDGTRVRLRHTGLPDESARTSHAEGWAYYLGRVAVAGTGADPGPDAFTSPD